MIVADANPRCSLGRFILRGGEIKEPLCALTSDEQRRASPTTPAQNCESRETKQE
jgi:hypothetical protein